MNNIELYMIFIMVSTIIGISLQNILVNDISELKWINRNNLDNIIILIITCIYNNVILILGLISFMISNVTNNNNKILIFHWILILINTIYVCNNNSNLMLIIIIIDIISVINIIFINSGYDIWYYLLYQSFMTIIIWWLFVLELYMFISLIYYYKLGSGIGGYYIPSLYSNIINKNSNLMIYIGTVNIILMYNPIFIFNNYCNNKDNIYILLLSNFLFIILILVLWISYGYIYINIWLYAISFSTIVLANIYYIFPCIDLIYYNLYYYVYYFTITSIIIWFIFVLSLHFISMINNNNNNNSNNNNNISLYISIYNVLQILLIMLIVLSLSSLLTVLERKGLASSQRRLGPSYNGWFGLVQIVMDGIKLVYKDYNRYNNINNKYIMISCVLNFVFSYLLFIFIYIDLILYINLSYIMIMMIIVLMINHITIVICGIIINNSKWTILSSIRLILLYFMYDIIFLLILLYISTNNYNVIYISNIFNINGYIDYQYYSINLLKYPILFLIYLFIVLIEAGRIPVDLIESESELISGYSIEYSGFLYALFASAEYSIILFHSILLSLIFFSYYSFNMLFVHITILFFIFVIIRSTLPRFKYTHLFSLTYYYLLPFVITFLLLL